MRLIGMLDSPYVRRVAISLESLGVGFEHEAKSVFNDFAHFKSVNSVVKAPTLICDDGTVLMDSTLILQYIEAVHPGVSLWQQDVKSLQKELRTVGLALAACEKGVQTIYERNLRPEAAQFEPWLKRVGEQLSAALTELEQEFKLNPGVFRRERCQASITAAITWQFLHAMLPHTATIRDYPRLAGFSATMEQSSEFLKYPPVGPGVVAPSGP